MSTGTRIHVCYDVGPTFEALSHRQRRRRWWPATLSSVLALVALTACGPVSAIDSPQVQGQERTDTSDSELTEADGWVPQGTSLSPTDHLPALANLEADLREAVQEAARDAAVGGVDMLVSSGWRSATYQQSLYDKAVIEHGSERAARAYVLPPDSSAHVDGDAVDLGPTDAMSWMSQHGADYGLCQTYANEMWHYQLTVDRGDRCPAPAPDASSG